MSSRASATIDFMAGRLAAALALAAFAVVGVAVVDDYGVGVDTEQQHRIGQVAVDYLRLIGQTAVSYVLPGAAAAPVDQVLAGPDYASLDKPVAERYYGAAFEGTLVLAERLLRLRDSRAVLLSRHLLTHLFFLTGGWFCYLLAYRLFGDRWLALFALLLFLLHPRIYAHSFFNSKDPPFLAMFMIALYLLHRAFRRDTTAAFALCGVGVAVLVNLRVMGIMLFAAAVGMRALDLLQARGAAERRRALATTGAFVLAACGTLYALSPYLWFDPLAIADAVTTLARHPVRLTTLFQGEPARWPSIPPHYLPTWMAITTPPATLLLCLIGATAVLGRAASRPRDAAGNTELRFCVLLVACLALPIAAVAALNPNLYEGWRQMYFLYAPVCLLSVYGLRALLTGARRRTNWLRRGLYALAAAALAGMAADVVRLHPHSHAYFNLLVDRRTPGYLRTQYRMLFWGTELREGLEYLLARYPDSTLHVDGDNPHFLRRNRLILPAAARRRVVIAALAERGAHLFVRRNLPDDPVVPVLYARRIYGNTVLAVTAVDLSLLDDQAAVDGYRAAYRAAAAGEPLARSEFFDLYLDGGTLIYVKEPPCRADDTVHPFALRVVPAALEDLPPRWRERGWQPRDFPFGLFGVRFDGRCLIRRPLPDYPIRALEVGWRLPNLPDPVLLDPIIDLPPAPPSPASRHWRAHAAIASGDRGPDARATFDLYLDAAGTELVYYKEPCAPRDVRSRFFLHLFPVDPAELAAHEREPGYYNHGFYFPDHGVLLAGGACVALVPLPPYEHGVARVRAGQFNDWIVEFAQE